MSIIQMSPPVAAPPRNHLSSLRVLTGSDQQCLLLRISQLSIHTVAFPPRQTIIRMGGGPRTYPGGVSKWQWKRMQAKKAKQLLKARLCRERQIYEMRKRAELRAAVSELERPWEVVERAPTLFSVSADEQLKVLADRFQKPGGFDLWTEKDGPQLFQTPDGLPSARFFPKGVVHSIKPYGGIAGSSGSRSLYAAEDEKDSNLSGSVVEARTGGSTVRRGNGSRKSKRLSKQRSRGGLGSEGAARSKDLASRKDDSLVDNFSYVKHSVLQISSEAREVIREASSNGDGRQQSGNINGGRAGKGSSHGILSKGNRQNIGYRDFYGSNSGETAFCTDRRGRIPLASSGRYKIGGQQFSSEKTSRKSKASYTEEVYNMSLQQDGSYGLQTNSQENQ
ncbi:PREDICTED: uncharacterized protein LOC104601139 [Nelumbo nucifera]|uniref:Uncharacterized protein LOC104601139 n=1 Tax=Nelumbo nucifera TaxID=4432 RepID=A0A1U8A618_NELNU|nr:PREDICTED: uncharacterized protein LOC104601139 [Nelumbo nucifera]XP_010262664.1 PREDICTED: uncharacterized protein LOC104601139 [Nelumbo nucifera]XP_010262665.1 PREDICTED: uncharacterized protein LOC104601139 [Nelumbo nucifera]XP_010262666.1 PREDICTED: uncharacterized protein LOC104601139 [Nelumbo nucifera]XP_010262667.1 PREDICTED: uncharacterized protein LOC104601139 [Nelumbo nucifera]XP_010262668.1 PREDICTED: uncharacterized protein LOC104601139 [Nelumbo nucifera]XP_010262669.1 PREDICTE